MLVHTYIHSTHVRILERVLLKAVRSASVRSRSLSAHVYSHVSLSDYHSLVLGDELTRRPFV